MAADAPTGHVHRACRSVKYVLALCYLLPNLKQPKCFDGIYRKPFQNYAESSMVRSCGRLRCQVNTAMVS